MNKILAAIILALFSLLLALLLAGCGESYDDKLDRLIISAAEFGWEARDSGMTKQEMVEMLGQK